VDHHILVIRWLELLFVLFSLKILQTLYFYAMLAMQAIASYCSSSLHILVDLAAAVCITLAA